MIPFSW